MFTRYDKTVSQPLDMLHVFVGDPPEHAAARERARLPFGTDRLREVIRMAQAVREACSASSARLAHAEFDTQARPRAHVSLFYDPPYENELDDMLARNLVAYLVPAASLSYKAQVWAGSSSCRFDYLIDLGTRRIAIDYTDTPANPETALVEDNDALALGSGNVDVVLRARRRDLEERLYDCLHLIAKWEPALFTPYGHRVFTRRASEAARCVLPEPEAGIAAIYYSGESSSDPVTIEDVLSGEMFDWPDASEDRSVVVRRMSREQPDCWRRQYERASLVYGRCAVRRR